MYFIYIANLQVSIYILLMFIFFSILISFILLKILVPNLILDKPNNRSNHINPTPRGGGIVFLFTSLFLIPFFNFDYSIYIITIPLAITGFYDDYFSLKSLSRFIVQLVTVLAVLHLASNQILLTSNSIVFIIFILIGTSIINFSNFIDGIDGLLCSISIIFFISSSLILKTNIYIPIIGSLFSFYFFNKFPAKVFMGDVGSTLLGTLIFSACMNAESYIQFTKLILIVSPILFDCSTCIIMRFLKKENIFKPHNLHLYQRLVKNGISQKNVTYIYGLSSILMAIAAFIFNLKTQFLISLIIFALGIYLDRKKAVPINI